MLAYTPRKLKSSYYSTIDTKLDNENHMLRSLPYCSKGLLNLCELDLLFRYNHPHLISSQKFSIIDDIVPTVELPIANYTLWDIIKQRKTPSEQKLIYAYKIACCLTGLHKIDIVHGDIQAGNVIFLDNKPYLAGLHACQKNHDKQPDYVGCWDYWAPELLQSSEPLYTKATDSWAFGIMLLYLMGERNFIPPEHDMQLYSQHYEHFFHQDSRHQFLQYYLSNVQSSIRNIAVELLFSLLNPDINERMTIEQFCHAPYFKNYTTPKILEENLITLNKELYPNNDLRRDGCKLILFYMKEYHDNEHPNVLLLALHLYHRIGHLLIDIDSNEQYIYSSVCAMIAMKYYNINYDHLLIYLQKFDIEIVFETLAFGELYLLESLNGKFYHNPIDDNIHTVKGLNDVIYNYIFHTNSSKYWNLVTSEDFKDLCQLKDNTVIDYDDIKIKMILS